MTIQIGFFCCILRHLLGHLFAFFNTYLVVLGLILQGDFLNYIKYQILNIISNVELWMRGGGSCDVDSIQYFIILL